MELKDSYKQAARLSFPAKFGYLLTIVLIILTMTLIAYTTISRTSPAPHLLNEACDQCHMANKNLDKTNAYTLIADQEQLCKSCHPGTARNSHPTGKINRKIPSKFPLDWKGDMTCSTCHEIHGDKPKLRRVELQGKTFCLACHTDSFFTNISDQGISLLATHLDIDNLTDLANIDELSLHCMGCHDELEGAMQVRIEQQLVIRHSSGSSSHPIGSSYKQAEQYGGYRPVEFINPAIQLPDGKVSCVSCHVSYSKNHGALITPSNGPSLCFQCHDI